MAYSVTAFNNYYTAANTFQSKLNSGDKEALAAELTQLQILYQAAHKEAAAKAPSALPKLQQRNTEILCLSKGVITSHLQVLSANMERLTREIEQSSIPVQPLTQQVQPSSTPARVDAVAKTVIKVACKVPFGLTIHGEGGNLNWDKGTPLAKLADGSYGIETTGALKYKLKLNGQWENWGDRFIQAGKTDMVTPAVTMPLTAVTVTCKPNQVSGTDKLFVRGTGSVKIGGVAQALSWEKGIPLSRVDDKFYLLLDEPAEIKFKLIVNDDNNRWSNDADRVLKKGENVEIETTFAGQPAAPTSVDTNRTGAGRVAHNDHANANPVAKLGERVVHETFDY